MAVYKVNEIWRGRKASTDDKAKREYTRTWRVFTNNAYDGPQTAMSAIPVRRWDPYVNGHGEVDFGSIAQKATAANESMDPRVWIVTVEYNSRTQTQQHGDDNPLNRPAILNWSFEQYQKPIVNDINGKPIQNSAKQRYDPPVTVDDSRLILTVEKNLANYDVSTAIAYKDAINSDVWYGIAPQQAKMANIGGVLTFDNNLGYYKVTFEIHFRAETWQLKALDAGLGVLDSNGKLTNALDNNGVPVTAPILLDGTGKALASGGTPVFNAHDVYKQMPFNGLNIP